MSYRIRALLAILFVILVIAGWATHVITTIQSSSWLLLLAGAIVVPIGILHGWGIWFGLF